MEPIDLSEVLQAYNGRSGCMCGCQGNYTVATEEDRLAANKSAGWEAIDDVKSRATKQRVNFINRKLDEFGWPATEADQAEIKACFGVDVGISDKDACAWFDDGNRNTVVYFKP